MLLGNNRLISFKIPTYLRFTVKLLIAALVLAFVFSRVTKMFSIQAWTTISVHSNAFLIFSGVFLLMVVNWSLEALKWQKLMRKLKPLTLREALKAVLAGLATGLITPNRVGNFIGRISQLPSELRVKATLFTFYANLIQFSVTVFFGLIGLLFLQVSWLEVNEVLVVMLACIGSLISIILLLRPDFLAKKPMRFILSTAIIDSLQHLRELTLPFKFNLITIGILRYFVFVSQYVLILIVLNQTIDLLNILEAVAVMYLLMTLIPSLFFGKLFVREAAGLIVFGAIGIEDNVILLAGFMIWFINIALPGVAGTVSLMKK